MTLIGIQEDDEYAVTVKRNGLLITSFMVISFSPVDVEVISNLESSHDVIAVREALVAIIGALNFRLQKPRLQEMLAERIAQLKAEEIALEESEPPSPADDCLPF